MSTDWDLPLQCRSVNELARMIADTLVAMWAGGPGYAEGPMGQRLADMVAAYRARRLIVTAKVEEKNDE